jgi:ribosomal protein S18 acetylase RimI-like enzyme
MTEHILMRRPLIGALPEPMWPEGVSRVPLTEVEPQDIHTLMALAYEDGGGAVPAFEQWWAATRDDSEFDPNLAFIAENALGHMVGFALVWSSAFVKDLVVHPEWRGKGIATALLAEAFKALANRGYESVALKVETNNPSGAVALYHQLGFEAAPS